MLRFRPHHVGFLSLFFLFLSLSFPSFAGPTLSWNTFLGGSGQHLGAGIATDSSGNVYTVGLTNTGWDTATFGSPLGNIGFQGGVTDGAVAKLDSNGNLLWYRFFGGSGNDSLSDVEVDSSGNVYVIGYLSSAATSSSGVALTPSPIHAAIGGIDIFVAKLDTNGAILWDTYLGGSSSDYPYAIDLDSSNNVLIGGETYHVWDSTFNHVQGTDKSSDGYVGYAAKLNSDGAYQWHRYLGTGGYAVWDIAADSSGNVYTAKSKWVGSSYDAEVYKLSSTGAQTWVTSFGSSAGSDRAYGLDVDSSGNVYVKGVSNATWGTSPLRAYTGSDDIFVFKLNSSGTLQWNTFLGGTGSDTCRDSNVCGLSLDSSGNIYTGGYSSASWGSPTTAFTTNGSNTDGFALMLNSSGTLQWNTFLGGSNNDQSFALTATAAGNIYMTGFTTRSSPLNTYSFGSPVQKPSSGTSGYVHTVEKLSNSYTLTLTKAGTGTGSVTSAPSGISCGSTCSAGYADSTSVTLTATADSGSTFSGWSGGGCSGTDTCTVSMSTARSITATFDPSTYTLTASKLGTGSGAITATGISCGSDCSEAYNPGTDVTLTATPSTGSVFSGWGGTAGCSGTSTCTTTMNAAKSVTATFTLDGYSLTIIKSGTGTGTISSSPSGISCGSTCSSSYDYGTSVTLTATPSSTSTFGGWGSGSSCSGTGTCTVTVDSAKSVNATFNPKTYTLTVVKSGGGSATITSSVAGINCGSTCSATYNTGTSVTLTASAASGSMFAGWSATGCSGTGTCTVTLTANTSVTAGVVSNTMTYSPPSTSVTNYMLSIAKSGSGIGTITSAPSGISCGSTCSKSASAGTTFTLTASAASGSTFTGWSGVCSGTSSCSVSMSANKMVSATFTKNSGDSGTAPVINDIADFQMGCSPATPCTMPTWSVTSSANTVTASWAPVLSTDPIGFTSDGKLDLINYHPPRGTYYAQYVASDTYGSATSLPMAISIPNNAPVIAASSDMGITGATLQDSKYKFNQFARNMDIKAAFTDYDSDNISYSWQVKDVDADKAGFISTTAGSSRLRSRIAGNVTVLVSADDGNGGTTTEEIVVDIPVPEVTSDDLNVNIESWDSDGPDTITVTGTLQSSVWPVPVVNGSTTASVALQSTATSESLTRDAVVVANPEESDDDYSFRHAIADETPAADDTVDVSTDTDTYSFTASGVPIGTDSSQINVDVYTAVDGENVFLANKNLAVVGTGTDGTDGGDTGSEAGPGLSVSATTGCSLHQGPAHNTGSLLLLFIFAIPLFSSRLLKF